eukprot:UN03274
MNLTEKLSQQQTDDRNQMWDEYMTEHENIYSKINGYTKIFRVFPKLNVLSNFMYATENYDYLYQLSYQERIKIYLILFH